MKPKATGILNVSAILLLLFCAGSASTGVLIAQSLDFPSKSWGISFGNSKTFTGLRFNFRDSRVEKITGVNSTRLGQPEATPPSHS